MIGTIISIDLFVGTTSSAECNNGIIVLELGDGSKTISDCDCLETRKECVSEMSSSKANYFLNFPIAMHETKATTLVHV